MDSGATSIPAAILVKDAVMKGLWSSDSTSGSGATSLQPLVTPTLGLAGLTKRKRNASGLDKIRKKHKTTSNNEA
jgi:hypothetical protein